MVCTLNSHFDVVVVGGGPSGIAAAVATARMGRSVALIERHDVLGGMGTAALVNNFCPAHLDGTRLIIGGIFAEIRQRLIERKAIYASPGFQYAIEAYNPEVFAGVVRNLCVESGVILFLGKALDRVEFTEDQPATLKFSDNSSLTAGMVVDTTGDGLVAARARVPFTFGRSSDQAVMPLTFCYEPGPIDLDKLELGVPNTTPTNPTTGEKYCVISSLPLVNEWIAEARATGELTIPRDHIAVILSIPGRPEYATVNFGRVTCKDPTDPAQLAAAEALGRDQINEGVRFFQKYLPGFENVRLVRTARQIGVRESRQIVGEYTLTGADAESCRQFDDAIAQCCYSIDIHEPDSEKTTMKEFARGTHFDVPWRCLIPKQGPANLVIGGRCISATQEAMSSFRVSPSVMAIGEAAGVTAALAASNGCHAKSVSPEAVRLRLLETGGILS